MMKFTIAEKFKFSWIKRGGILFSNSTRSRLGITFFAQYLRIHEWSEEKRPLHQKSCTPDGIVGIGTELTRAISLNSFWYLTQKGGRRFKAIISTWSQL